MKTFCLLVTLLLSLVYLPNNYYEFSAEDFFELSEVNQPIDVLHPDYRLLDAALFHQTNLERQKQGLSLLVFHGGLYKASVQHTEAMVRLKFFAHDNPYDTEHQTMVNRIERYASEMRAMGENIEERFILDPEKAYCVERKQTNEYRYYDCDTHKSIPMLTYKQFAKACLNVWMHSSGHRHNILSRNFRYLSCAGRVIPHPFSTASGPSARLTQDFGGN